MCASTRNSSRALVALSLAAAASLVACNDPDILTDFVAPPGVDPALINGSFFVFRGLRHAINKTQPKFGASKVSKTQPKGLLHFQFKAGTVRAIAYAAFSSANPGTVSAPAALFGSGIDDVVLEKAFKVSADIVHQLQLPFQVDVTPSPAAAPGPLFFPVPPTLAPTV